MKVEYFQRKIGIFQREIWSYLRTVSGRVIENFIGVKRLDDVVLCIQGWRKTSSSKFLAAWKRLRIVNKGRTFSYKYFLDFEEKYGKISDCRTFNYFKTESGCLTFSDIITRTSATLTVCVTILICCFAWTTTSTTLSSASSSPRAGNFNWPLVLFDKDGKLQWKKKCMNENVVEQHFHFKLTNREGLNVLCSVIKHAGGG